MADLQQSVVSDVDTKQQINNQIVQWEENLERLHCEQFRLRCYMASLQSGELPNPKVSASVRPRSRRGARYTTRAIEVGRLLLSVCADKKIVRRREVASNAFADTRLDDTRTIIESTK